jgi:hypothetical protein
MRIRLQPDSLVRDSYMATCCKEGHWSVSRERRKARRFSEVISVTPAPLLVGTLAKMSQWEMSLFLLLQYWGEGTNRKLVQLWWARVVNSSSWSEIYLQTKAISGIVIAIVLGAHQSLSPCLSHILSRRGKKPRPSGRPSMFSLPRGMLRTGSFTLGLEAGYWLTLFLFSPLWPQIH